MGTIQYRTVPLACGHNQRYRNIGIPRASQEVYCRQCQRYVKVDVKNEIRIRCQARGCRYSRGYGEDLDRARNAAGNHVTMYPQHHVVIRRRDQVITTIGQPGPDLFRDQANEHQQALRRFVETVRGSE